MLLSERFSIARNRMFDHLLQHVRDVNANVRASALKVRRGFNSLYLGNFTVFGPEDVDQDAFRFRCRMHDQDRI